MFGMGMGEIVLIAVVALLVLGPERLPGAAKALGKGIRGLRQQSKELQSTIEADTKIGAAVREIRGALRGDPESLYKSATGEDWRQPGTETVRENDAQTDDATSNGNSAETTDKNPNNDSKHLDYHQNGDKEDGLPPVTRSTDSEHSDSDMPTIRPASGTVVHHQGQRDEPTPPSPSDAPSRTNDDDA